MAQRCLQVGGHLHAATSNHGQNVLDAVDSITCPVQPLYAYAGKYKGLSGHF